MSREIVAPVVDEPEVTDVGNCRVRDCIEAGKRTPHSAQATQLRAAKSSELRWRNDDSVFKQFQKFFRRETQTGNDSAKERVNSHTHHTGFLRPRTCSETDPSLRVQETRWLWKSDREPISRGTNVWEHEDIPPMNFKWERILRNTSIVGGIEDWVKRLEVPDVPDNRVKLIFASISAERKKNEMCKQIQESLLQTDPKLCPLVIHMQINGALDRLRVIKYSVETIEDVLILLSRASLDPKQRDSLIETLAATIHGDVMDELIQFSHARNLLLVSLGLLLGSNFKSYAFEVLKALISGVVREDVAPRSNERKSLLAEIIGRCSPEESVWLRAEFLALYTKDKDNPASKFRAVIHGLLPKESSENPES